MVRKFYFDNILNFSKSRAFNVNSSIGSAIRNASGVSMRKVIESRNDRTEVTVDKLNSGENLKNALTYGRILGISAANFAIFQSKLLTCPKILSFISIKPINLLKIVKSLLYRRFHISSNNAACTSTKRY